MVKRYWHWLKIPLEMRAELAKIEEEYKVNGWLLIFALYGRIGSLKEELARKEESIRCLENSKKMYMDVLYPDIPE